MSTQLLQENSLAEVQGKLIAALLLGKVKTSQNAIWGNFPHRARAIIKQMEKHLGSEAMNLLKASGCEAAHAMAARIFDRMLDTDSEDTQERLRNLPVTSRFLVERVVAELTGEGERGPKRWQENLWRIKTQIDFSISNSSSEITPEEVREGFGPMIHTLIDELYNGLYPERASSK